MHRLSLLGLRRGLSVAAAGALVATGLSLALATPSQAASAGCTISFTPNEIGPGQVTVAALTTDGPTLDYRGVITRNGVAVGDPVPVSSTNTGSIPYEILATSYLQGSTEPVVLDYQIIWSPQYARLAEPSGPMCHATLTLRPPAATPPAAPATPTGGDISLTAPKALPLSAGTAKIRATSTVAGPITLTSTTPKVCAVEKGAAKLLSAGVCTVAAAQGDSTNAISFRVWATPVVPHRATTPRVVTVLGRGESALKVSATPASVCRTTDGDVALIDAGTCTITVRGHGHVVRRAQVRVALATNSATVKHRLKQAATVYFAYNSAQLSDAGKSALRGSAKQLRKAHLVVVYGNTYGPGKNSKHSRALAGRRAQAVADYLGTLGVKAEPTTVPLAMRQPVSKTPAKNRRAEVYFR